MTMRQQQTEVGSLVRYRFALIGLIGVFFVLDQGIKSWVLQQMTLGESIPVWPGVFHLTYLENSGVAFSLFQEYPQALTIVTFCFFIGFLSYALSRKAFRPIELTVFSLVLGGASGNLWDRLTRGQVVDYLDVTLLHYPVFNLADTFIFCGVALLLFYTLRGTPTRLGSL